MKKGGGGRGEEDRTVSYLSLPPLFSMVTGRELRRLREKGERRKGGGKKGGDLLILIFLWRT